MAVSYYKIFRTPIWIIVESGPNQDLILEELSYSPLAVRADFPTNFKDTLFSFAGKGWKHLLPQTLPHNLDGQLAILAAIEHIKHLNPIARIIQNSTMYRSNRIVTQDSDYDRIFNEIFLSQDPMVWSQIFKIGENCHETNQKKVLYYSKTPYISKVINELAHVVITIGDSKSTIDITNDDNFLDTIGDKIQNTISDLKASRIIN
jgi:hypothetical protein